GTDRRHQEESGTPSSRGFERTKPMLHGRRSHRHDGDAGARRAPGIERGRGLRRPERSLRLRGLALIKSFTFGMKGRRKGMAKKKSNVVFGRPKTVNPAVENNPKKIDLRRAAARWIKYHPHAMKLFLKFARDMVFQGRKFGIGLLTERVRWQYKIEGKRSSK